MPELSTRPACLADLPALLAIEQRAQFHPWPEAVLKRYLAKPDCTWVLFLGDVVQAYAVNTLIAGEAELLMIAVEPSSQGKGLGRALMNFLLDHLEGQGAQRWFLDVRESNQKAIALYESLGFCQAGVRPNYYPTEDGSEDALLYCLELGI